LALFLIDELFLFCYIEIMKAPPSKFIKVKTSLFGFKFALGGAYANPAGLFFCPE